MTSVSTLEILINNNIEDTRSHLSPNKICKVNLILSHEDLKTPLKNRSQPKKAQTH